MAKTAIMRDYIVRFATAESYEMGGRKYWQVTLSDWLSGTKHPVTACSFTDLERQVRELAAKEKRHVSPAINLADRKARKPAGFDQFCKSLYVIEYVPVEPEPALVEAVPAGWAEVTA
jgi:hypothetical protein